MSTRAAFGRRSVSPGQAGRARGQLVLVATPIGNLGDLSPRAQAVLAEADLICCEDTRRTRALLSAFEIRAGNRLLSLHGHNETTRLERVAACVAGGRHRGGGERRGDTGHLGPGCVAGRRSSRRGARPSRSSRARRRCSRRSW